MRLMKNHAPVPRHWASSIAFELCQEEQKTARNMKIGLFLEQTAMEKPM